MKALAFGALVQIPHQGVGPQMASQLAAQWQQAYQAESGPGKGPAEQFAIRQAPMATYVGNGEHALLLRSMPPFPPNVQLNILA
ncbi:MAG: hypothetical protein VKJ04_11315 [Vampirovibrionales bacterium]|nr:hypothetical protein [Vampirovibrionales bacterium]